MYGAVSPNRIWYAGPAEVAWQYFDNDNKNQAKQDTSTTECHLSERSYDSQTIIS